MSITITNEHGQPITDGRRINVRIAHLGESSDQAIDDRFVDNGGSTGWPGGYVGGDRWTNCTLHVNFRDVDVRFGKVSQDVNLDLPIMVQLPNASGQPGICPVNFNKDEFRAWFEKVRVGPTVTRAAMEAMKPALVACGFEWQNMCRNPSEWRPRIHQPPFLAGPCTGSTHDVDCGDFAGPWNLTFRY